MNSRNYGIAGLEWSYERPDGSSIGGPIMVMWDGELLPLHNALRGLTQKSFQAAQREVEERRKTVIGGLVRGSGKRCDELLSVTKDDGGGFTATCMVKGKQRQYQEYVSGLE